MRALRLAAFFGLLAAAPAFAAVLPDDRADLLYHRYEGGGVTIDGPSVLVRKKFLDKVSVSAGYYVDMVSSASIDVQLAASPYREDRTQYSLGVDYLRGKSTYSLGFIDSSESDYDADTAVATVSQDLFGDLTTISFSYRRGWDQVWRNVKDPVSGHRAHDPGFAERADRRGYAVDLSQILTRNMVVGASYEVITDEGYLNSPYRSVRYLDPGDPGDGFGLDREIYPRTRTSNAASFRMKYFLSYRAALEGRGRFYSDTWGIRAWGAELGYTHPAWKKWIFDAKYRYYTQDAADFYSDLLPRRGFQNFQARDKELATFASHTLGVGASYQFAVPRLRWIERSTLNLRYDHMMIDYEDFRDATATDLARGIRPGGEPLYSLDADVFQLFVSIWF